MPTKLQILNSLAGEREPISRESLATVLGEPTYRTFQVQLDRFEKAGLVEHNDQHGYSITDSGRRELEDARVMPGKQSSQGCFLLSVTESDLADLDGKEFVQVWEALGKIIRKRSKKPE